MLQKVSCLFTNGNIAKPREIKLEKDLSTPKKFSKSTKNQKLLKLWCSNIFLREWYDYQSLKFEQFVRWDITPRYSKAVLRARDLKQRTYNEAKEER